MHFSAQNFTEADRAWMARALALAEKGLYITSPNPRVGCVLVRDGVAIGEGYTQPAGQDHAEVQALKDCAARGFSTAGATAYVSLEPCSHQGRTPPCTEALVHAGVRRVVLDFGEVRLLAKCSIRAGYFRCRFACTLNAEYIPRGRDHQRRLGCTNNQQVSVVNAFADSVNEILF